MEIHQLDYVLAVAHHQNFSRAAEDIKVSQPSLSQQITKLESELGTSLFERTTRYVQLTPAGREFVTHAKRILSEVSEARDCIQEYVSIKKGHLKLGALAVVGYYNLPNLMSSFQKKFPGIKLDILEGQCEDLLYMLHSSKIDAAFVQITKPNQSFRVNTLVTDKMVLVTNYLHPLANRLSVELKELQNEKFIITPATSGHYQDFHNACLIANFTPTIVMSCAVVKTMLSFVREGLGVTVLSSKVAEEERDAGIKIIPLTPSIHREIALVTRNNTGLPPALKVFLKFTSQWLKTESEPQMPVMQQLAQSS
ncbi:LysR family transcriptional regulator [Pelotomaculum propionicicum]|uniref:HTH-type transcriptional regulator GltC n=1 Tax=Pelotomaculum propionicicum TaxID=258475 RepID=A0A4Y7RPW0_9FIRM|nr:LysR family transcriptional regulator [Pelotomaculum propionicicum]NLI14315.1 LysR family transcriptional regulator [Peptococcaceae bacterium]TEB10891.1 HTH-type transcriptional regulator GltC [Pelotomaculum propionicicum]